MCKESISVTIPMQPRALKVAGDMFHELASAEAVKQLEENNESIPPMPPVESLEPPVETPPTTEPTAIEGVTTPIETAPVETPPVELDSEGIPWCADIHSASQATLAKDGPSGKAGSFKLKKGLKQKMTAEQINQKKAELKASIPSPVQAVETPPVTTPPVQAVETPPVTTAPVETPPVTSVVIPPGVDPAYFAFMRKCTDRIKIGELTMEDIMAVLQTQAAIGGVVIPQVAELNSYPALVPLVDDGVEAVWIKNTQN